LTLAAWKKGIQRVCAPRLRFLMQAPLPRSYGNYLGRKLFHFLLTVQGVGAFALITLGVILTKLRIARGVNLSAIRHELARFPV